MVVKKKQEQHSGIASIIGRPSSGKSSLLNRFCGQMVAIVSPLPQTTHNNIRGIVQRKGGQVVFCDTPGFHISKKKMNQELHSLTLRSVKGIDALLYMIDCTRKPGQEEEDLVQVIQRSPCPVIVAINKIDCIPEEEHERGLAEHYQFIQARLNPVATIPISVHRGDNVEKLLSILIATLPEGEALYPEDVYTDQDPVFRIAEIIRGEAWKQLKEELPYSIYIDVYDTKIHSTDENGQPKSLHAYATIFVERDSQKGIVIGKAGKNIELIRLGAEKLLHRIFPYPVKLHLRVQISPKWRKNVTILRKQIY